MNLYDRIPNNVNLSEDKRLQRALEKWLPNFLSWWHDMGPEGFQQKDVWLRTAVDVGSDAVVADVGVDRVSEVDRRRATRQGEDLRLRSGSLARWVGVDLPARCNSRDAGVHGTGTGRGPDSR